MNGVIIPTQYIKDVAIVPFTTPDVLSQTTEITIPSGYTVNNCIVDVWCYAYNFGLYYRPEGLSIQILWNSTGTKLYSYVGDAVGKSRDCILKLIRIA